MSIRRLEASRLFPLPATPYELHAEASPFAMLFVHTRTLTPRRADDEPDKPAPTSSDPSTTTPDSNDPSNDEEIDWMQDD